MTGIKAMKAKRIVAIDATLSAKAKSWKNITKLATPKSQIGKKIVKRETIGIR